MPKLFFPRSQMIPPLSREKTLYGEEIKHWNCRKVSSVGLY
jgi:hypothetical protein